MRGVADCSVAQRRPRILLLGFFWIGIPLLGRVMSAVEKAAGNSSSSLELDPLLKDLSEKRQSFRKNVSSLAAELKDVRSRLASQEESFVKESLSRKVAETKAMSMEEEIGRLKSCLEEKNGQLMASTSSTEQYLKELDDLRSQLSITQVTAETSAASAQSAQSQCMALLRELDEKNQSLKEHEIRVNKLAEQLDHLQNDLQTRELSQKQLKDEVIRIEREIMQAMAKAGDSKNSELMKILDEISPKNFEKINKHLSAKDEEIARLRDEIRFLSAHWKHKTKELEAQLEKHRRTDQELKKRVLKLESCLQESRSQIRKLQRMGERRDKALKELREQVGMRQQNGVGIRNNQNFWESSGFKVIMSMSMLVLIAFSRR